SSSRGSGGFFAERVARKQLQGFQVVCKLRPQVFALQRKLNRGFQESQLVTGIVTLAFKGVAQNSFSRLQQTTHTVSQLEFTAGTKRRSLQRFKNCRRQNITANDGKV